MKIEINGYMILAGRYWWESGTFVTSFWHLLRCSATLPTVVLVDMYLLCFLVSLILQVCLSTDYAKKDIQEHR